MISESLVAPVKISNTTFFSISAKLISGDIEKFGSLKQPESASVIIKKEAILSIFLTSESIFVPKILLRTLLTNQFYRPLSFLSTKNDLKSAVLSLKPSDSSFEPLAIEVFQYQYEHNPVYQSYVKHLGIDVSNVTHLEKIPCLPISFFKSHRVVSDGGEVQHVFESSGTTGSINAKHYIFDLPFYEFLSIKTFEEAYGSLTDYHILALLPSYLERDNSSLVYMVKNFMFNGFSKESGFYLDNKKALIRQLKRILKDPSQRKVLMIGVTFALLDLIEEFDVSELISISEKLVIMETGGMKGRREELIRPEVHDRLKEAFGVENIHSEYGMTELLSQAYAPKDGFFKAAATMRVLIRDVNDPFSYLPSFKLGNLDSSGPRKTGGINIIDLANIDTCSFIETQDLGRFSKDYKTFEILGRFDNSDVRGCNLMAL